MDGWVGKLRTELGSTLPSTYRTYRFLRHIPYDNPYNKKQNVLPNLLEKHDNLVAFQRSGLVVSKLAVQNWSINAFLVFHLLLFVCFEKSLRQGDLSAWRFPKPWSHWGVWNKKMTTTGDGCLHHFSLAMLAMLVFYVLLSPGCVKSWPLGLEKTTETNHLKLLKVRPEKLNRISCRVAKGPWRTASTSSWKEGNRVTLASKTSRSKQSLVRHIWLMGKFSPKCICTSQYPMIYDMLLNRSSWLCQILPVSLCWQFQPRWTYSSSNHLISLCEFHNGMQWIDIHSTSLWLLVLLLERVAFFEKTPTKQLKSPKILWFVIDLHNFAILSPSFTHKALGKMDHHCPSIGASDKWIHEKNMKTCSCVFSASRMTAFFPIGTWKWSASTCFQTGITESIFRYPRQF